jgi:hypothetical protein
MNGERYWRDSSVQTLLDNSRHETAELDQHLARLVDGFEELLPTEQKFFSIAEQILPAALDHLSTTFQSEVFEPFLIKFVKGGFQATLQSDPKRRKSDAGALPIKIFAREM